MAVLDHYDASSITAKREEPNCLVAICNICLVFAALIGLAYVFSLIV
jgi:hypothetical protein